MCSTEKIFNGVVSCIYEGDNNSTAGTYLVVKDQNCVTYDNFTSMPLSGNCPYRFQDIPVPGNKRMSEMNTIMCGELHRGGKLCGDCDNLSEFSFNTLTMQCVPNCTVVTWTVYFIMDIVPIVVFFVIVAAFNIRVTSPMTSGFIIYAQVVSLCSNILAIERDWTFSLKNASNSSLPQSITRGLVYFYSIWSLDIFDALYPSYCLNTTSHHVKALQAFAFQYVSAAFSLLLTASVYIFVDLYGRNFYPVVVLWRPFRVCFAKFRRNTDFHDRKTSIIDIFATFVVLSYTKFTIASFQILAPTWTYTRSGEKNDLVMYYDGTVRYFEGEHKAYAALAIIVLIVFVLLPPLLLILYPLRCCQRWLDRLNLRCQLITAFTDAYQGCFKDGSTDARDCRSFASIYFLLRIVIVGLYAFAVYKWCLLFLLLQCTVCIAAALFVIIEPYKKSFYNKFNAVTLLYYLFVVNMTSFNGTLVERDTPSLAFQFFYSFAISFPAIVFFVVIGTILLQKVYKKYCMCQIKGRYKTNLNPILDYDRSLLTREEITSDDDSECFSSTESVILK